MANVPLLICATPKCEHSVRAHIKRKVGGIWQFPCRVMICSCTEFQLGGSNESAQRNAFLSEKKD
jgi:hypothetical protein